MDTRPPRPPRGPKSEAPDGDSTLLTVLKVLAYGVAAMGLLLVAGIGLAAATCGLR